MSFLGNSICFFSIPCQILRVSYIHLVGCPWQWVQIPQKSNEISEILRKFMEFISDSRKLHRKSWEIPANIIGFHKKLLGRPWEWIRVISAGGAPQAPWRHTEGCARGAPTSFRIGPEFVGSLTKIKALVLWQINVGFCFWGRVVWDIDQSIYIPIGAR